MTISAMHGQPQPLNDTHPKMGQRKFPNSLKVFVKNLPQEDNVLGVMKEHFASCGHVQDMHVYEKKISGKKFKQMLAVFSSEDEVEKATELTGTVVGERHIIVAKHKQYAQSSSNTVGVLNLSLETDEEDLWQFFEDCGTIKFIHIDRLLNVQSYRAEIHFENAKGAKKAAKHNGKDLKGNTISVSQWNEEPTKEFPVYVSDLPCSIQKEDLAEFFDGCGSIKRIKVIKSKQKEEIDATVFFTNPESAEKALAFNGNQISDHVVSVTLRESAIAVKHKYTNPLYIVGISRDTQDVDIFLYFQDCGLMNDVKFVASKSGCLKKAVIDFKDAESVNKALAMKNAELNGKKLILSRTTDVLSGEYPDIKPSKRKHQDTSSSVIEQSEPKKGKKKDQKQADDVSTGPANEPSSDVEETEPKKKKKKVSKEMNDSSNGAVQVDESLTPVTEASKPPKKKKKAGKQLNNLTNGESLSSSVIDESEPKKKKKKSKGEK